MVQRAKQAADETGNRREAGLALCHEFEVQLEMRNVDQARDLVQEITAYADDEEVKYDFTRNLVRTRPAGRSNADRSTNWWRSSTTTSCPREWFEIDFARLKIGCWFDCFFD